MSDTVTATPINIVVNGRTRYLPVQPNHQTLLDSLRELGLTGAKEGCAEGECGACAVAMVVPDGERSSYRAINSCLMSANAAAGREFYTVEGLAAAGTLCESQAALAAAGGSQCGYCTPGFVVSLFCEHYRRDRTGPCDPLAMAGNLCRCTGYRPIRDAALSLGAPPAGVLRDRLRQPAAPLQALQFDAFARPRTVQECVSILADRPQARLMAGGTDVMVECNLHGRRFEPLVSIDAIDELCALSEDATSIVIGAGLPLSDIAARWTTAPPVFHEWLTLFASPPIRQRATLGGNLATASPIGDAAPLLLALDATVHVVGLAGRRAIPIDRFVTGYRQTALARGELIVSIEIPKPLAGAIRFYKISKRRLDDISTVAAAIAIDADPAGTVRRARFAYGGVAATPVRVAAAERALTGSRTQQLAALVPPAIVASLQPMSDHRGSREYRLAVAARLAEKFAWECQL
jgi:xanthine dehydrogenase small subunit